MDLTRPSGWREFRAGKNGVHWLATYEHADPAAYDAAKTAYDAAFEAAMGRRPESWEYELGRKAERLRYFRMGQPSGWPPVAADGLYYNWYDDLAGPRRSRGDSDHEHHHVQPDLRRRQRGPAPLP